MQAKKGDGRRKGGQDSQVLLIARHRRNHLQADSGSKTNHLQMRPRYVQTTYRLCTCPNTASSYAEVLGKCQAQACTCGVIGRKSTRRSSTHRQSLCFPSVYCSCRHAPREHQESDSDRLASVRDDLEIAVAETGLAAMAAVESWLECHAPNRRPVQRRFAVYQAWGQSFEK